MNGKFYDHLAFLRLVNKLAEQTDHGGEIAHSFFVTSLRITIRDPTFPTRDPTFSRVSSCRQARLRCRAALAAAALAAAAL